MAPTASRCDCPTDAKPSFSAAIMPLAASFRQNAASLVDEPKPKAARAPIDRDICSLAHSSLRMFSGEVKLRFSTQKGFLDAIDHQFRLFNHQEMASIGHIFDRVVVIPACDEIRPN